MAFQYLLLLDNRQFSLFRWRRGTFALLARCALDEESQLAAWFGAHPGVPVKLIVNRTDEEFQIETIPRLRGRDREAVLNRKLEQHFFDTPYILTGSLGRINGQRPEERILLAALTRFAALETLLRTLEANRVALVGLYSVALLVGDLCRRLNLPSTRCLVFSFHSDGMRESLVMNGQTVFSRFAPSGGASAENLVEEAEQLRRYLAQQRKIEREETLTVCPLLCARTRAAIADALHEREGLRFIPVDTREAAVRLGYREALTDDDNADFLFLQLLATRPPKRQFAPDTLRRSRFLPLARLALLLLGPCFLCAGLLLLNREWQEARQLRAESDRIAADVARQEEEVNTQAPLSAPTLAPENLRLLVSRYDRLSRQPSCLRLDALGQTLDDYPELWLDRLHWQCGAKPVLTVEGSLMAENAGTPRQAVERFGHWLDDLRQHGARVEVLRHPVDHAPEEGLEDDAQNVQEERDGNGEKSAARLLFRLRLAWEETP
jgi:hypothetical protein